MTELREREADLSSVREELCLSRVEVDALERNQERLRESLTQAEGDLDLAGHLNRQLQDQRDEAVVEAVTYTYRAPPPF